MLLMQVVTVGPVPRSHPPRQLPQVRLGAGLARNLRAEPDPLQNVLRHTQDGVYGLDLLVPQEGQAGHSKEGVERIHLQPDRR